MAAYRTALVIVLSILAVIEAKPKCKTFVDNVIICSAGNSDYELERGLVSDNNRTTGITLRDCRITSVEYESFSDLNSLTYLDLSVNKIQRLKLGVLDEPKKLTHLNLSYNQLTEFPLGLFDQITNLNLLDLKGNKINKLELGIFDTLRNLKYVDLSHNDFLGKDFNPYLFDQSPHITFIDFSRNNMEDAPTNLLQGFQSLETLNLDGCSLSKVPGFVSNDNLRTMKNLILSRNLIRDLNESTAFDNLDNLQHLDLSGNMIEIIHAQVLQPLKHLQKVDLKNNKIAVIPDLLFKNLPKLITIDLYGNQLQNVPVNAFREVPLKNLNIANNKVTYLQDNFCLELRNSGGKIKKLLFDPNPWQCACLNDLLKEVKRLGIEYNSGKYDGKRPVCVSTTEFTCKRHENENDLYIDMFNEAKRKYFKQKNK